MRTLATSKAIRPEQEANEWAARLAAHSELGDSRLDSRLAYILDATAQQPGVGIPQASGNPHQAKATYRFLSNNKVTHKKLVQGFGSATATTCAQYKTIYAVQDTTSLNYTSLKSTTGLGPLNDSAARGLHVHSTVAVTADGVLLGLLDQDIWARAQERSAPKRRQLPIEEKESFKWLRGMRGAREALAGLLPSERPRLVHVMDREGDVHEVFEEIQAGEGFLIRCAQNRNIDPAGEEAIDKAHAAVERSTCLGTMDLSVAKPREKSRKATLELRAVQVTLAPRRPNRQAITLALVEAREIDPPEGATPILWRLWTSEPVESFDQIVGYIQLYSLRWRVEEFHLTLKSGCGIEKLELERAERLQNAIAVYSAVAIRIVNLRDLGKRKPDTCCTQLLSDIEWRVLVVHFERRTPDPDETPPIIREAMRYIGRLGGHLGRKSDGLPGVRTLWRGWRALALLVAGYRAANIGR